MQEALTGGEIKRAAREEVEKTPLWQIIDPKLAYLIISASCWTGKNAGSSHESDCQSHARGGYWLFGGIVDQRGWQVITMNAYRDPSRQLPEPTGEVLEDMGSELLAWEPGWAGLGWGCGPFRHY